MKQTFILTTAMFVLATLLSGCGNAGSDSHGSHDEAQVSASPDHDDHDSASDGHDDHDDDHDEADADLVKLTADAASEAGIETATVIEGAIAQSLSLPAEIRFDADRVANVSPKVSGVIGRLYASEGDQVGRGDTLALIQSRELASLKSGLFDGANTQISGQQSARA